MKNNKDTMNIKNSMKVALCCIACQENAYIKEWVDYYFNLGVDDIFIYDNNKSWQANEHFEDVFGTNYNNGRLHIIDKRDIVDQYFQINVYTEFYKNYGDKFDWVAYFDCDEFLTLYKTKNIKEFLGQKKFDPFQIIKINWLSYNDNGHIYKTEGSVQERFPEPSDMTKEEIIWENRLLKSIVRGGLSLQKMHIGIHTPIPDDGKGGQLAVNISSITYKEEKEEIERKFKWEYRVCFADGEESFDICYPNCFTPGEPKYDDAVLKHYRTKSCEEYISTKAYRGFQDCPAPILNIGTYFYFNEYTPEKMDYFLKDGRCENPIYLIECRDKMSLGDRMFIYAAARYSTRNTPYKFDYYWVDNDFAYGQETVKNTKMFSDVNIFPQTAIVDIKLTKNCTEFHHHINQDHLSPYEYFPIEIPLGRNIKINGLRNSIRYFDTNLEFALSLYKDNDIVNNIKEFYSDIDFSNTAAVYIDEYTKAADLEKFITLYQNNVIYCILYKDFNQASNMVASAITNTGIFLSNISWINSSHPLYSKELVDMYFMSMCRVNFLNFHNTTMWWGAYLNTNYKSDILIPYDRNDITSLLVPINDDRYKNINNIKI